MNKIKIMDQVTVYQDVFSDSDLNMLLDEINKSEIEDDKKYDPSEIDPDNSAYLNEHGPQPQDKNDGSLIYTWTPWYTYGKRSIWNHPSDFNQENKQHVGFNLLKNSVLKTHCDYVNEWAKDGKWTYDIQDWNIGETEEDPMVMSTLEILKHKKNNDEKYTIPVHTDWHNQRVDEPGPKQILTYTIYLNDDYDGGEIDFIDETNSKLIVYKPKRGDITVFPSGRPYWHGARAVTSDKSKIFIRTFALYRYPVTEKWINGLMVYGPTEFLRKENERLKSIVDSGIAGRQAVPRGGGSDPANPNPTIYYDEEIYIDGRIIN